MKALSPSSENIAERMIIDAASIPGSKILIVVKSGHELHACKERIMSCTAAIRVSSSVMDKLTIELANGGFAEISVGMRQFRGRAYNIIVHPWSFGQRELETLRCRARHDLPLVMISTRYPLFSE